MTTPLAIGVDLGATKIEAALVTHSGDVLATTRQGTPVTDGATAVFKAIATCINHLIQVSQAADGPISGIGIGTPGQVNPESGVVLQASNLNWHNVNLRAGVSVYLNRPLPLTIQRDSLAELLGEQMFGAGIGHQNLVYLGLGTGLGGAAMTDGRLITGHTFTASEIGHLVLDPHGRRCACGLRGCAETLLSGSGAAAQARDYLQKQNTFITELVDDETLDGTAVLTAARLGDPLAHQVILDMTHWLTRLIAAYTIILNPEKIIIGGGFGKAALDLLIPHVQKQLPHHTLNGTWQPLQFAPAQLPSSAIGASTLVWQGQKNFHQTLSKTITNPTHSHKEVTPTPK